MNKDKQGAEKKQESQERSSYLERECYRFLYRLLGVLDVRMDRRLVVTFLSLVMVILMHRHRNQGLLLSELGGYLRPAYQAPAGTKRISNLLHSKRWDAEMIETYLWMKADERVSCLSEGGRTVLVIWDESVIEKPESLHLEGLCAVRSSKAKRLKRIKPGYYNPPGGRPICVPGYHWLQVLVMGLEGPVTVAKMRWWTTRGEQATQLRTVEGEVMDEVAQAWGQKVIHVWDRGFAGAPWLSVAFAHEVRFIMRWPKRYQLLDIQGQERKAWEIVRGKRSWDHRLLWDARRRCQRKVGVFATPVFDKDNHHPLWLVVARPGSGREPWYLLTNEPISTSEDAWRVVLAYARRWNIEMAIRFDKCELAFESPRLRKWDTQLRLLLIATLAFAFLLSLLPLDNIVSWLLQTWCHRTGKWRLKVKTPLYRLRSALCRLWLTYPPPLIAKLNSG
jgi:hypothetical protein